VLVREGSSGGGGGKNLICKSKDGSGVQSRGGDGAGRLSFATRAHTQRHTYTKTHKRKDSFATLTRKHPSVGDTHPYAVIACESLG
jgi:hypothetical protein